MKLITYAEIITNLRAALACYEENGQNNLDRQLILTEALRATSGRISFLLARAHRPPEIFHTNIAGLDLAP